GIVALGAALLTAQAMREDARDATYQEQRAKADERAAVANRLARAGVPPEGPLVMLRRDPSVRGPALFDAHCASCHTPWEHGKDEDRTAPRLDGWSTEAWVLDMLHDPDGDARFGRTPYKGEMPSLDVRPEDAVESWTPMPKDEMAAVAAFLFREG